jgi:dihydroflavonol-4-reductase
MIPGREPFIPPVGVKLSKKKMFFDARKATRELGLPQTPVREALRKAIVWFATNGYLKM